MIVTLEDARLRMPPGYRLEAEQVVLVAGDPPLTADAFSVYVEARERPVFCGDTPARALRWAQYDAARATMEPA